MHVPYATAYSLLPSTKATAERMGFPGTPITTMSHCLKDYSPSAQTIMPTIQLKTYNIRPSGSVFR
jgi:hypothetical protein